MDWDLLKIVLTLAQAAKDWPLLTLIIVCITALFAIPVAMVTKRWLDMTWLNRDSYIAMLAEHKGRLQKEVEEWRRTAENALAGERRLIDQMSGLQKSLGDAQKQLTEAREREEELVRNHRIAEIRQQLDFIEVEKKSKQEIVELEKELKRLGNEHSGIVHEYRDVIFKFAAILGDPDFKLSPLHLLELFKREIYNLKSESKKARQELHEVRVELEECKRKLEYDSDEEYPDGPDEDPPEDFR